MYNPAFPTQINNTSDKEIKGFNGEPLAPGTFSAYAGLSMRDYFAAAAIQGLCSNQEWMTNATIATRKETDEVVAIAAYEFADAMLAQRNAQGEPK